MEIPVTVEGEIPKDEAELAEKLRSCCSSWGVERESKLHESASILLDMGRLYLEKAKNGSGMLQKLNFIKSAALISGARVRFEKWLKDEEKCSEARQLFQTMSSALLNCSKAQDHEADLLTLSDQVALLFSQFREEEKVFIKRHLAPIGNDVPESELKVKQKGKIESMRKILKKNTAYYKAIMKYVSEECIKTLGVPPCKFALVGLGSLSREEVTLYSDFEHVILLEEGIDASPDGRIRDYFRWYSVMFQVIIVALGETYIPTVGVKSLNDLYTDDETKNWFFDLYTPGGVSFDGRFPHSCKIPIGKQEATKNKKFVIELIQPADVMLKYLTSQQDLKNGYHLRDVLVRTCLVHGDKNLYLNFKKQTSPILTLDSRDKEVVEQAEFVAKNVNSFLSGQTMELEEMDFEKTKDFFYRPITVLVGCLSRVCRRAVGSNLAFFSWFRGNIGTETAQEIEGYLHDLEYAVAVAAEIRLKVYSSAGYQRQKTSPKVVCRFVGQRCAVGCFRTILLTSQLFQEVWREKTGFVGFFSLIAGMNHNKMDELGAQISATMLDFFGFHEDALHEYKRLPDQAPASTYLDAGVLRMAKREEYFHKAEELLAENNENETFDYVRITSQIFFWQGCYQKGLDLVEKWIVKFREEKVDPKDPQYIELKQIKARLCLKGKTPAETMEYASKQIECAPDLRTKLEYRMYLYGAQILAGDMVIAKENLLGTVQLCRSNIECLPLNTTAGLLRTIFQMQVLQNWKNDATATLELLDMLQGTSRQAKVDRAMLELHKKQELGEVTEIEQILAAVEHHKNYSDNIIEYGNTLGLLLKRRGISNFFEVAVHFHNAPLDALYQPSVYNWLHNAMQRYYAEIKDASFHKVGLDLVGVFRVFEKLFFHPRFVGTFRDIIMCVVTKTLDLRPVTERHALMHSQGASGHASMLFNRALCNYAVLNIEPSARAFWRIINDEEVDPRTRSKSCKFMAHMTNISPFALLINYLREQRPRFLEAMSFPKTNTETKGYNKAVEKYVECNFKVSSCGFWRIIFNSKRGSTLQKRSIEMLMFVILFKWDCDGFPMHVGGRFIVNEAKKSAIPAHTKLGDFYSMLFPQTQASLLAFMHDTVHGT